MKLQLDLEKLKETRKALGYNQTEVAEHLGISLPSYCYRETGKIPITLIEAEKISKLFKKSINEVFFKRG